MEQSKKISRKVISVVLSLLMVFSCFSGMGLTAWATSDKTVAGLGTNAIGNPTSTNSSASAWAGSYVYYGKYDGTNPTKYRVLDRASNDFGVAGGSLLLDCDTTLYNAAFHDSNNTWSSSSLRSGLQGDAFWNKEGVFTEQEKDAIASSKKADAAQNDGSGSNILSYAALSDDTVFVLDAKEASRASYGYASDGTRKKPNGSSVYGWWLRSPYKDAGTRASFVYDRSSGNIQDYFVKSNVGIGVSPAFNINLSSVIFASLITGTAGAAGAEYKLTLKDDNLGIALTSGKKVTQSENTLTIPYTVSGDNSANATQVSVLVTDKAYTASDAKILKYGKLADVTSTSLSGTANFTLPDGLTGTLGTDYHVYLLAEDVNGEKETDYANLKEITADDISTGPDKSALTDAITAAETLYDSIKDDTDYSTIASTLKTAIDAAKEVADSDTADQDAVDAAKTAITTAKTNAEAAKKDVDDTNAANAVITQINALPANEDITSANKVAIEAARAAYNALTDDQKKKVDATVLAKLTNAETALQDAIDTEAAGAATNTINALPDADEVTTADKEKIEAARKAYNDLTDDQKKKVSDDTLKKLTDAEDALAAATVSEEIGTLPDADKITAENKAAIEAAKKTYDELTDEQKQYVDKTTKEKLETAVTALAIALLPAADEITAANKEAIEAARKAYDALTDEQKSELGTAAKEKLEAAETALAIAVLPAADDVTSENKEAIEAARKAYDALNDAQKASVGTAAKEKLEAAEAALAIALLPTPSDVSAEDKEAIETARKAYDALNDKQKASVGKTAKEKLEAAQTVLVIAELPETDEITTEDKAAIEAARKAYDALNDAQKELAGDEAKAKLEAAEVALTKALVEALPAADKVTAEDKDAIEAAIKAYDALTDEQKLSVGEDAKAKLEAAQTALAIAELPAADKVTAEDKAAIEAAAKAYDALSDEQKEMVGEVAKAKLEAAKAALAIALLPEAEKVTSADKADIEAARKAYDALTDEQKSELGTAAKEKLEAAEVKLTKELISELPKASKVTTADATDVAAAKETFDKLNDEQKKGITPAQKAKLEAAVQALSDAEVYEVRTAINKLPVASEVTAENEEAIKDARKAYDALTDEQKVFVGETAKSKLIADEAALDIAKLPAQSDVTAEDKDDIAAARKTYDALTLAQKEELGENAKNKLDNAEVGLVERQLEALPTEVTGSEREAIEAARKAYDALTDEQKASVNPEALKKLTDAEAVIDAAEKEAKDTAAANAVSDTINAIPAASEVTPENKDAIEAARKAYEELTDDQKAKVTPETLKKLTDAETALKEAIDTAAAKDATDKINAVPETDKVTTKDEAAIDAARKAYDALTEDQKAKIAPETLKKLTDAEEALTVAKNNVAAFNANKALEQKAADELALATDSAAGKKLIANAKAALDKLAYDESKTPEENKAAQQAVLTKLKADLKEQRVWESEVARAKLNSNARGTANKKGFNVTWGAAPNAAKYVVYAAYCDGKSAYKKVATVKGDVNSYSITKLGGKKVDTSKCIRVYIIAYRLVNGKYVKVAQSVALHIAGVNNKTQTNAKAITVKNDSLTLKLNKSTTLKPTIVRENAKKKMSAHTAQFRYQSTNLRVVKVDANGKITAVGKGTATIYVFANNGKLKSVKITVK